jgi:hypothetical protein
MRRVRYGATLPAALTLGTVRRQNGDHSGTGIGRRCIFSSIEPLVTSFSHGEPVVHTFESMRQTILKI